MQQFKSFSNIENSYRQKYVEDVYSYGLQYNDWVVTEKLDGSNFSFYMSKAGVKVAKRSGFIKDGENFFNYEYVLKEHMPYLHLLFQIVHDFYDIPYENLEIILYGEIFGGVYNHKDVDKYDGHTKVQERVHYSPANMFYAFDMMVNGRIIDYKIFCEMMQMCGIFYAKPLFIGTLEDCLNQPCEFQTNIPKWLGLPEIEDNKAEGIVIKPIGYKKFPNGKRVIFKKKSKRFSENNGKVKEKKVIELNEEQNNMLNELDKYINENRLRSALSKIGEVTDKDFGKIMKEFMGDIFKDFAKENHELIESMDKGEYKVVSKMSTKRANAFLRKHFLNIIDGTF